MPDSGKPSCYVLYQFYWRGSAMMSTEPKEGEILQFSCAKQLWESQWGVPGHVKHLHPEYFDCWNYLFCRFLLCFEQFCCCPWPFQPGYQQVDLFLLILRRCSHLNFFKGKPPAQRLYTTKPPSPGFDFQISCIVPSFSMDLDLKTWFWKCCKWSRNSPMHNIIKTPS